ncbi:iron-sulfur cluster repair di-iron protein [Paenibacillus sp. MBLB2552]|uniref:Iron-sulfur cluster repair di-iron protein n=1 Tax=Paenibacillus mellifer TaxID=2937794 RepID=A0A9X1XVN7_9BACL|nr:iron-sulfur cluster repair di-iron protein [Paenibacillus mellifer]MCK8486174.1 iron-sulfur cluster repair di-iron protein [Paenibacillus mellifer]
MDINPLEFQITDRVRDIVLRFPKAADYFRQRKIDFCCGGNRPITEAAEESGVPAERLLDELNRMMAEHPHTTEGENWLQASSADLVKHIVGKHHRYLREELPEIQKYVTKVSRVHGEGDPHLLEVARLFGELRRELLEHTDKEEAEVFPKMLNWDAGREPEVLGKLQVAIADLESEHDGAGNILKQLRELTEDFQPPTHACTTYRLTYARLEELEGMTFTHVHLENNVLFPRYTEVRDI